MIEIQLVRHGMTEGNRRKRYIGRTDEPLCPEGVEALKQITDICAYREDKWQQVSCDRRVEQVFVSPLMRCRQTAEIFYPGLPQQIIQDLRECDFGDFENKNHIEMEGDPDYQAWIDSNGTLPFPNGEAVEGFKARCVKGFQEVLEICKTKHFQRVAVVAHGGTIMSVMEHYGKPEKSYYEWHPENGCGYLLEMEL